MAQLFNSFLTGYDAGQQIAEKRRQKNALEQAASAYESGDLDAAQGIYARVGDWQSAGALGQLSEQKRQRSLREGVASRLRGGAPGGGMPSQPLQQQPMAQPMAQSAASAPPMPQASVSAAPPQAAAAPNAPAQQPAAPDQADQAAAQIPLQQRLQAATEFLFGEGEIDEGTRLMEIASTLRQDERTKIAETFEDMARIADGVAQSGVPDEQAYAAIMQQIQGTALDTAQTRQVLERANADGKITKAELANFSRQTLTAAQRLTFDREEAQIQKEDSRDARDFAEQRRQFGVNADLQRQRFNYEQGQNSRVDAKEEARFRGEFTKSQSDFLNVRDAFATIRGIAERQNALLAQGQSPTAAGDMSMIFSYMKMLDPTSVVREGEYANAQNAASVPERIRNAYNKAATGSFLQPDQRNKFMREAEGIYQTRAEQNQRDTSMYRDMAGAYGFDQQRSVPDFSLPNTPKPAPRVELPPVNARQVGQVYTMNDGSKAEWLGPGRGFRKVSQ